ncbi:MAG: urease accessory protein UreE [Moorea sp. SIO3C2]|nr:urease accessory protein UreE [Moorena sp. SIO3C2]
MSQEVSGNAAGQRVLSDSPPFIFTRILEPSSPNPEKLATTEVPRFTLALTAHERTKSRHYFEAQVFPVLGTMQSNEAYANTAPLNTQGIYLRLPRGTVLHHDDQLTTEKETAVLQIVAKPEAVMTAIASNPLDLVKAAYHLGNRHVSLEVTLNYLRFSPDPVLKQMLERMGLTVTDDILAFQPEAGAYGGHPPLETHHHHSH